MAKLLLSFFCDGCGAEACAVLGFFFYGSHSCLCLGDAQVCEKVVASCPRNEIKEMAMSVRTDLANYVSFLCTHWGEKTSAAFYC